MATGRTHSWWLVLMLGSVGVLGACGTVETSPQDEDGPGTETDGGGASGSADAGSPGAGGGIGGGGTGTGTTEPGGTGGGGTDPGETDGGSAEPVGPCMGPNPQGCSSNADCADGQSCQVSDTRECIPSSCFCDEESGSWACTRDCGNTRCMPVDEGGECDDPAGCDPVDCPAIWAPVCGVDGVTYGNDCEAASVPVEVDYDGPCEDDDDSCAAVTCPEGAACVDGDCVDVSCTLVTCEAGLVCSEGECIEDPCNLMDCAPGYTCEEGTCIPTGLCDIACFREELVCGSDGVTYTCGAVEAECNGATVVHDGACEPEDGSCAAVTCPEGSECEAGECVVVDMDPCATIRCRAGYVCEAGECVPTDEDPCTWIRCAAGQVCEAGECIDEDSSCAAVLCGPGLVCERGECVAERDCTINCFVPDPVCGDNGVTYWCGEVEASCNEVMVAYDGECIAGGGRCASNDDCVPGELCMGGVCEPGACPMNYDPVCGSDGVTYGNACLAGLARVEIVAAGPCEGSDR